jgi:outer membrane protein TolC
LKQRQAEGLPTLAVRSQGERIYISGDSENSYSTTLNLAFPLFTGFSQSYNVLQAETEKRLAEVQFKDTWQQRSLAIWSSYNDHKTALERIKASIALVKSAEQSYQVSLGRYQEGLGDILDLLSAQTILENARTAILQAKTDWLISLAQLKRDIGILDSSEIDASLSE